VTSYLAAMAVFAGLYALMALGLNLIWGLAGMINLGLVGFYAIGAYTTALLTVKLGLPPLLAVGLAACLSALTGGVVAIVTARLKGDYLAIVTLGFAEVVRLVASNEIWLTGGTSGVSNVPGLPRDLLSAGQVNIAYAILIWIAVAFAALALGRLSSSPFGRVLRAIREDEMVAAVAGKRVLRFKVQAFMVGAFVLGAAGALYAHYVSYVAPDAFLPLITIYVVLALTAGGTGTMRGALLGAVIVVALTEGTRFLGSALPNVSPVRIAALREGVIGVALILVLTFRPQGLLPERQSKFKPEPT
jgi:branched-chain amino acid transport system permease protein